MIRDLPSFGPSASPNNSGNQGLITAGVAALNLVLDFDFIEKAAEAGAPRYMQWYAGFGLMLSLIWIYVYVLRLIALLRSRE